MTFLKVGFRKATQCEVCGQKLVRRRTDQYATGHARCWAVWRANGHDMARARAVVAKAVTPDAECCICGARMWSGESIISDAPVCTRHVKKGT